MFYGQLLDCRAMRKLCFFVTAIFLGLMSAGAVGDSTFYTYDALGRLVAVTAPNGVDSSTISYSYDAAGNRNSVQAIIDDVTPPNPPTNPSATALSNGKIRVNWTTSQDVGGGPIWFYQIYRGGIPWTTVTAPPYDDSNLTANQTYSYRISAVDLAENESTKTASVSAKALDVTPPSAPGKPKFSSIGLTNATAKWTASSDNVGVTGYRYRLNGGSWKTLGNVLTVQLSGLGQGTTYTMQVQARDAAGNWSASSSASFTTTHRILIAQGYRPPKVQSAHQGTYHCEYFIDWAYMIEWEACSSGSQSVYGQMLTPPGPVNLAPGYSYSPGFLWVESNHYGN